MVVLGDSRVAIVTGAGSGLGRATAEVLSEAGTRCVLVGRRQDKLQECAESLASEAIVVSADVASADERHRIAQAALERFGRIDVLVNNAGICNRGPLLEYSEPEWREVMAINLEACFFLAQTVLPTMRHQGWGRIVNISSVYGTLALNSQLYPNMFPDSDGGPVRQPAYHSSKGGLLNLTRDLAVAVAPWGVTVNAISPGMFLTEQSEGIVTDEVITSLSRMTPAGRFGEPREIGYAVRFLASNEAAFITGTELKVDGGWSAW